MGGIYLVKMSLRFFHPDVIHGREVVKRRNGSLLIAPRQKLTQKKKEEGRMEKTKPWKNLLKIKALFFGGEKSI